jgi:hypothetical protein
MAIQDVARPTFEPPATGDPNMPPETFRYTPFRFLHVMLLIAWSAFRHPFSTSVIDLTTGKIRQVEE